jgi:hypothetical protein
MAILLGIVFVAALGGGGWFLYASFVREPQPAAEQPQVPEAAQPSSAIPEAEPPTEGATAPTDTASPDASILFGEPVDLDGDGLDAAREGTLGTDPNNWDTDGDLLSDYDEVVIWKSDPLNPDTDGDGFSDGEEVKNGYSPTGSGKIFELPAPQQ